MTGQIKVTIQTEKRLKAISDLAEAIKHTAQALSLPTQVTISGCHFQNTETAISIDATEEVKETLIQEVSDA